MLKILIKLSKIVQCIQLYFNFLNLHHYLGVLLPCIIALFTLNSYSFMSRISKNIESLILIKTILSENINKYITNNSIK